MYCGGGSGGSGVNGSAELGTLSSADTESLCDYLVTLEEVRTVTCMVDGQTITITFGTPDAEVDAEVDECVAELATIPSCNATVDEAEACAEGNANQIEDLSDDEICDIVAGGEAPPPVAACEAFEDPSCEEPE